MPVQLAQRYLTALSRYTASTYQSDLVDFTSSRQSAMSSPKAKTPPRGISPRIPPPNVLHPLSALAEEFAQGREIAITDRGNVPCDERYKEEDGHCDESRDGLDRW